MEKQSLPSDIDKDILNLTRTLASIAEAYSALAQTVKGQAEKLAELEADKAPEQED